MARRRGNPNVPNRNDKVRHEKAETEIQRRAVAAMPAKSHGKRPRNPIRTLREDLGMTQREFATALGVWQSSVSPAETGVVRYPRHLFEAIKAKGYLPPEKEESFLADWQRWLRWFDRQRNRRADVAGFIDRLSKNDLGVALGLISQRINREVLDRVGPYAN